MRFDHERIPERVVHARGTGAFGTFKLHKSAKEYTNAGVLNDNHCFCVFPLSREAKEVRILSVMSVGLH